MTREEIKQEAEEQVNVCTPYHTGSFIQGYIAAVESWQAKYEKQKEINKELVDENEALKFAARMSEKTEKQLREENAELKKEVLEVRQHLELTEREWGKDTTKLIHFKTQLTKAKEIITKLIDLVEFLNEDNVKEPIIERAEQFLKGENIILEDAQAGNSPFDADEVFNKEMKAYPEEK